MRPKLRRLAAMVVMLGCLAYAYTAYEDATLVEAALDNELSAIAEIKAEIAALEQLPPRPLKSREDTVDEFVGRLLDDSELLGSSVRFNLEQGGLRWDSLRFGVVKAGVSLSSASEIDSALGYFKILWDLIAMRPVGVRAASMRRDSDATWFTLDVDVYAIEGGA